VTTPTPITPLIASPRRFTLADAMILVAAMAIGFAWSRAFVAILRDPSSAIPHAVLRALFWIQAAQPCLMTLFLATLICRLRPPRPPLKRLIRQPGLVASAAAVFVYSLDSILTGLHQAANVALSYFGLTLGIVRTSWFLYWAVVYGIACSWILLAVSRRWRAEPSWVDRLGRVLGATWLVIAFLLNEVFTFAF